MMSEKTMQAAVFDSAGAAFKRDRTCWSMAAPAASILSKRERL